MYSINKVQLFNGVYVIEEISLGNLENVTQGAKVPSHFIVPRNVTDATALTPRVSYLITKTKLYLYNVCSICMLSRSIYVESKI